MKKSSVLVWALLIAAAPLLALGVKDVPEWENPRVNAVNKEPAHATLSGWADLSAESRRAEAEGVIPRCTKPDSSFPDFTRALIKKHS